MTVEDAINYLM